MSPSSPNSDSSSSTDRQRQELLEEDRAARRAAQRDFDHPLVLEAGAGTGKTTTLVARILAWSLGPGWEAHRRRLAEGAGEAPAPPAVAAAVLQGVVAITFTEAAAAEMATRVGVELAGLATGQTPSWLDEAVVCDTTVPRAQALAGVLDHLTVRTIHAFCRSLLAEFPLEAGLHPRLEVDADGTLVEDLVRETVEARLAEAYGEPGDADFLALAALEVGPLRIAEAVAHLAAGGVDPCALEADPLGPGPLAALARRVGSVLEPLGEAFQSLTGATRAKKAVATATTLLELHGSWPDLSRRLQAGEGAALDELLAHDALGDDPRGRLGEWARGKIGKAEGEALGEEVTIFSARCAALRALFDHLRRLDPQRLHHGRRVVAPLLAEVKGQLRARGVATFSDLLVQARDLLVQRRGVRRRVRQRMDQLLVDEFQDTDPVQCDLLAALALDTLEGADDAPGLFLVGDPKQSIYGWRSADLAAYDGFLQRVREAGGTVRPLVENFRSVPAILREVERCVEPVMEEEEGVQPRFQPLLACERRQEDEGFVLDPWRPVEHWVSWVPPGGVSTESEDGAPPLGPLTVEEAREAARQTTAAAATALEAHALARDLLRLRREGVAWGDVGLLLRSSGDLDVYLEALRQARIPFAVARDKQYFQRREIIDAAAVVRAVLDPGDTLALLTFLRSIAVGAPDAALLPLWRHGLPGALAVDDEAAALAAVEAAVAETPREIPGLERIDGWPLALREAVPRLLHLRRLYHQADSHRLVEALRALLPLELLEAARYQGAYRLANLHRFFRQLRDALDEGVDTPGLLRLLRRSVAESLEAEEGRPKDADGDAVQVLTIHGAKGLDFRHVYLLQLHKRGQPSRVREVDFGRVESVEDDLREADGGDPGSDTGGDSGGDSGGALDSGTPIDPLEYVLFGAPTLGWDLIQAQGRAREAAERVRLLYVALTRPKDRLVTLGVWPAAPRPVDPAGADAILDLMGHRPGGLQLTEGFARVAAAVAAGDSQPAAFLDDEEARWVFPGLDRGVEAPLPAAAPPGVSTGVDALRHFHELRRRAVERQQRPWSRAASALASHDGASHQGADQDGAYQDGADQDGVSPAGDGSPGTRRSSAPPVVSSVGDANAARESRERRADALIAHEAERDLDEGATPFAAPPASLAPSSLAGDASDASGDPMSNGPAAGAPWRARRAALAAGTAVHRCLEDLDLEAADPAAELDRQIDRLEQHLVALGESAEVRSEAYDRARRVLAGLRRGHLLERLQSLAPEILARELPVLLPSPPEAAAPCASDAGEPGPARAHPVGYLIGSADLLYRDPERGELVVVDYKTDEPEAGAGVRTGTSKDAGVFDGDELQAWLDDRARHYAPQVEVYRRAVAQAFGEGERARCELWFLALDRAVSIP